MQLLRFKWYFIITFQILKNFTISRGHFRWPTTQHQNHVSENYPGFRWFNASAFDKFKLNLKKDRLIFLVIWLSHVECPLTTGFSKRTRSSACPKTKWIQIRKPRNPVFLLDVRIGLPLEHFRLRIYSRVLSRKLLSPILMYGYFDFLMGVLKFLTRAFL